MHELCQSGFNEASYLFVKKLKSDKIFNDVTLVSKEGKTCIAHKVVLASFSEKFKKIFTVTSPSPNSIVFLSNISKEELDLLLDFIYLGECQVSQNRKADGN